MGSNCKILSQKIILVVIMSLIKMALSQDMLGPMNVFRDNVTLSGFSSGGAMAQMFQISYSTLFQGIAVFSHGRGTMIHSKCGPPDGDIDEYDRYCTTLFNLTESELWDPARVHEDITNYLAMGLIEDPINLKDKRLYVYTGLKNALFSPRLSLNILQVYEPYIQSPAAIKTRVQNAVQLLPSNKYGGPCNGSVEETDFIGNCGFSGVTEAINFILFDEENNEAFETPDQSFVRENVTMFDQTEFTQDLVNHNMDDVGYYYVPMKCKTKTTQCYLHFYFHGCFTGREFNGASHVENSGLIELAEKKSIIMIFPQAKSSVPNPIGCWDTFGVAGKYYATQQGPQVTALKRILDRILENEEVTTTAIPEIEPTTKKAATLSRIVLTRSSASEHPGYSYPQKLNALVRNPNKLTYLPPPESPSARLGPLRRSQYKTVKRHP